MKISSSLTRVIKLVVERRNAEAKRQSEAAIEDRIRDLKSNCRFASLLKELKEIRKKEAAVEDTIKEAGFWPDGQPNHDLSAKLKNEFKPELTNLDEVLALLATSDESKAKKILSGLGIQW